MVLQAFIDESYDDEGIFVLAGYISTSERWATFSEEWREALPQAQKRKDGRYSFKMSQMARSPDSLSRVSIFHDIIQRHVLMGISFVMNKRDLNAALNRISVDNTSNIFWEQSHHINYLAARFFIEQLRTLISIDKRASDIMTSPLDLYFDDHSQKQWILQVWDEFIERSPENLKGIYGAKPRFENDDEFLPLQAADFYAWWIRKWATEDAKAVGEDNYFGFERSEKKITSFRISVDEDQIAECLKIWMSDSLKQKGLPEEIFRVRDTKRQKTFSVTERVDPPFPLERLLMFVGRFFRRILRRGEI